MNFYDDQRVTNRQLFDRFFPGREDVVRLLMEPITYANGSTLGGSGDYVRHRLFQLHVQRACSSFREAPIV